MKSLNNLGRIVWASTSPRRKDILKKINLDFKVIPSNIIEDFDKTNPSTHVQTCAFEKAKKVSLENLNNFIIGFVDLTKIFIKKNSESSFWKIFIAVRPIKVHIIIPKI